MINKNCINSQCLSTFFIVAIIFSACLMMIGPMRGGLPVEGELTVRLEYITNNLFYWQLGWLLWMTSALGLFLFATFLASHLKPSVFRTFGLGLMGLGIVPDLIAETLYGFIIPMLYEAGIDIEILSGYEQIALYLTGFLGNGLYNLGGIILTILLLLQLKVAQWVVCIGLIAWLLGLGLSISVMAGNIVAAEFFTATSMVVSTVWMVLIAQRLFINDAI